MLLFILEKDTGVSPFKIFQPITRFYHSFIIRVFVNSFQVSVSLLYLLKTSENFYFPWWFEVGARGEELKQWFKMGYDDSRLAKSSSFLFHWSTLLLYQHYHIKVPSAKSLYLKIMTNIHGRDKVDCTQKVSKNYRQKGISFKMAKIFIKLL